MADSLQTEVTHESLTCPICFETYNDSDHQPKLLQCHHTFCRGCIKDLRDPAQKMVNCPTCRKRSTVEKISELQTNFYINEMRDLLRQKSEEARSRSPRPSTSSFTSDQSMCRTHPEQTLTHICTTCRELVCQVCITATHQSPESAHNIQEIENATEEYRHKLNKKLFHAQMSRNKIHQHMENLKTEMKALEGARSKAEDDIDHAMDLCVSFIDGHRKRLKDKLNQRFTQKQDQIGKIIVEDETHNGCLESIIDTMETALANGQIHAVLAAIKNTETSNFDPVLDTPKNYLEFSMEKTFVPFQNALDNLGSFEERSKLPGWIQVSPEQAVACLESHLTLTVSSSDESELSNYPIFVDIQDKYGDTIKTHVDAKSNGTYNVKYRPQVSGVHKCCVKFHDTVVKETEFLVQSNDPVFRFGKKGEGPGQLNGPRHVITYQDRLYTLDKNKVQCFTHDGRYITHFEVTKAKENFISGSSDIAINRKSHQIICPETYVDNKFYLHAERVKIFTMDGQLRRALSIQGTDRAVMVSSDDNTGNLLVCDDKSVMVIDKQGQLLRDHSIPGNIGCMCAGRHGDIIVGMATSCTMSVLDINGRVKHRFGSRGSGKGELLNPLYIDVDKEGNIVVCDSGNNRIQIFTYNGDFVCAIESLGDPLDGPLGLSLAVDGHVLVADKQNNCIKKYKYC